MKKLFQNPIVAWGVLILAVVLGIIIGAIRKPGFEAKNNAKRPTELLKVERYDWVNDSANMLSDATEATIARYNTEWNDRYYSVVAVATVPKLNGWTEKDYAAALGEKWTLGAGDMLLLLVRNGDWYVACGDNVLNTMTDTQETNLKKAIDEPYYKKNYDEAVVEFFRQADVFYAQAGVSGGGSYSDDQADWQTAKPAKSGSGVNILGVILLIGGIFLVWAIIDRVRYGRYQRRMAVNPVHSVSYYPIFWGRPARTVVSSQTGTYHRPSQTYRPSGAYHSNTQQARPPIRKPGLRPANAQSSRPPVQKPGARPATPAKPTSKPGGFGKGGFGGGKR